MYFNRKELYKALSLPDTIPADFEKDYGKVIVPVVDGESIVLKVRVVKSKVPAGGPLRHRVLIACPKCGFEYPFSRLHQHIDRKKCQEDAQSIYDHIRELL